MTSRDGSPLLEISGLSVCYPGVRGRRARPAVNDFDLVVRPNEAVGVVGESGAGKSTVARTITGELRPTSGRISFAGRDLSAGPPRLGRRRRSALRLVVHDGYAALPPHRTVAVIIGDQLPPRHRRNEARLVEALNRAGLDSSCLGCYPHQLAQGERQRVVLAGALACRPRMVVADEPTDPNCSRDGAELVELLGELPGELGVAVLHLTSDLNLARRGCDRLVVLRGGRVVEQGPTEQVLAHPEHPYTEALVAQCDVRAA